MAQNITLLGASYSDVPGVKLPKTGGGQALFTDVSGTTATAADVASGKRFYLADGSEATGTSSGGGGGNWKFFGGNAELVSTVWNETIALSSTDFATWTPSTSQKLIRSAQTGSAISINVSEHDYVLFWKVQFTAAYNAGATLKNQIDREWNFFTTFIARRPNSRETYESGTLSYTDFYSSISSSQSDTTPYMGLFLSYYNSSSKPVVHSSLTSPYGIYAAGQDPSLSSSTSTTPTITPKCPVLYARCNTSYFATSRASELDQANSKIKIVGELYRCKYNTYTEKYLLFSDMLRNPI